MHACKYGKTLRYIVKDIDTIYPGKNWISTENILQTSVPSTYHFCKEVVSCPKFFCSNLNMTGGNISCITQDNEASVVSGITSVDSINIDNGLSLEEKKKED